jgi:hypothetical protein
MAADGLGVPDPEHVFDAQWVAARRRGDDSQSTKREPP